MIQRTLFALVAAASIAFAQNPGSEERRIHPKVREMPLPKYPPVAQAAGVSGDVHFLVLTDGEKVTQVLKASGPPLLIRSLEKHLRSWSFELHEPIQFEITYRCSVTRVGCEAPNQPDVVRLELPSLIEISATIRPECDPVELGRANHHMSSDGAASGPAGYPER